MPKIVRAMKKAEDGKPVVEASANGLGVRGPSAVGRPDVDLDDRGAVILNGKGMSVAPDWRDLPKHRIPIRLKAEVPNATGNPNLVCFRMGQGPFRDGPVSDGLELLVDRPGHGVVAPRGLVPLDRYQDHLAATRDLWTIDES